MRKRAASEKLGDRKTFERVSAVLREGKKLPVVA
jgi:hypothetical protein